MKSHTRSSVEVSLNDSDVETLIEEGEITDGTVTITLFTNSDTIK